MSYERSQGWTEGARVEHANANLMLTVMSLEAAKAARNAES
jgi:hypothetical protein